MRPSRGPRPDAALTMNRVSMEVNWLVSRREPGSRPVRRYCWTVDTPPPGSTSLPSAASAAASSDPLITTVTRRWARRPSDGVARSNCVLSPVAGWAVPGRVVARRQPDYCSRVSCVRPCCQGPLGGECAGPQVLVKVERPQRSEDERHPLCQPFRPQIPVRKRLRRERRLRVWSVRRAPDRPSSGR
jgi:hypothetical protein